MKLEKTKAEFVELMQPILDGGLHRADLVDRFIEALGLEFREVAWVAQEIGENAVPEPKFKRGDLVRHRASGEVAVVVGAKMRTIVHPNAPKEVEFTGAYDLDLGFREDVVTVDEYLLEPADPHLLTPADPEPEGEGGP